VDVEAGVFPGEEVGEFAGADELGFAQGVEEAVAEEFDGGGEVFGGHAVEAAVGGEEAVGGEDVEVRVEEGAEGVAEGFGGGVEEDGEELAAFAEDAAQDAGDGEDELAVGTSWQTAVAIQSLVERTRRWWQAGQRWRPLQVKARRRSWPQPGQWRRVKPEARSPQRRKILDGGEGVGAERAEGGAVEFFVMARKRPRPVDDLPEGRGAGAAGLVDGGHKECS
jgi:hypothetical protein